MTTTTPTATDAQMRVALDYYRRHTGPATIADIRAAADPHRNFHTLAELTALHAAGIETRS
jgi:hypothetical protein